MKKEAHAKIFQFMVFLQVVVNLTRGKNITDALQEMVPADRYKWTRLSLAYPHVQIEQNLAFPLIDSSQLDRLCRCICQFFCWYS